MKVRDIKISIKSDKDLFKEVKEVWGKLERGEKVKKHEGISFESLDAMWKVLTEERLRILKTVKKEHPQSVYELAKMLGRDLKNVNQDLKMLAEIGLVSLERTEGNKKRVIPHVDYGKILLEIPV